MPISHMEALCKTTYNKPEKLLIRVVRQETCKCLRLNGGGAGGQSMVTDESPGCIFTDQP